MRASRLSWWLVLACCLGVVAPAAARGAFVLHVRYEESETASDRRATYPIELLHLALEKSGRPYVLRPQLLRTSQARTLQLLASGREIDVAWTVTTPQRERELRPVRFPIDRGLFGWRVLLMREGASPLYAQVRRPADLAPMLGAQGHDWPDLGILRANGLRVAGASTYDGLFHMLVHQRVDYVPRSVLEVDGELRTHAALPLQVEPTLALHYPSALYFFVHPDNVALADALTDGLERARRDGSLDALFDRHYGAALRALALDRRRVLRLKNPQLPPLTPVERAELWFSPENAR